MSRKLPPPSAVKVAHRRRWAKALMADIETHHPREDGRKMSLRHLGTLLGTSHQAPMSWMDGSSVPTSTQVARMATMAKRNVEQELVLAEYLRATERRTHLGWQRIAKQLGVL